MTKDSTSRILVPFALGAMGAMALALTGCERKAEVPASAPASYMEDAEFRGKLKAQGAESQSLLKAREAIVSQMKAMVDAKRAEMKADDKTIKAALEKDPEWNSLYKRCQDLNTAITEQRRRTMGIVRERIAPKKAGVTPKAQSQNQISQ